MINLKSCPIWLCFENGYLKEHLCIIILAKTGDRKEEDRGCAEKDKWISKISDLNAKLSMKVMMQTHSIHNSSLVKTGLWKMGMRQRGSKIYITKVWAKDSLPNIVKSLRAVYLLQQEATLNVELRATTRIEQPRSQRNRRYIHTERQRS